MDQVNQGAQGAAVGQEIVDEQDPFPGVQKLLGDENGIGTLALGEGLLRYTVPSMFLVLFFLAKTTGTWSKAGAARQAMPMPEASMVRIRST